MCAKAISWNVFLWKMNLHYCLQTYHLIVDNSALCCEIKLSTATTAVYFRVLIGLEVYTRLEKHYIG